MSTRLRDEGCLCDNHNFADQPGGTPSEVATSRVCFVCNKGVVTAVILIPIVLQQRQKGALLQALETSLPPKLISVVGHFNAMCFMLAIY